MVVITWANLQTRRGHWTGYIPLSTPEGLIENIEKREEGIITMKSHVGITFKKIQCHFWANFPIFPPGTLDISESVLGNTN